METMNKKNLKLLNQINSFGLGIAAGSGCGGGVGGGCMNASSVAGLARLVGEDASSKRSAAENFSMSNLESRMKLAKSLNSISGSSSVAIVSSSCSKLQACKKTIAPVLIAAPERSSSAILSSRINNTNNHNNHNYNSNFNGSSSQNNSNNNNSNGNNNNINDANLIASRASEQTPSVVIVANMKIYDRTALLKRFTEDFYTLDKDMHFEFCVSAPFFFVYKNNLRPICNVIVCTIGYKKSGQQDLLRLAKASK